MTVELHRPGTFRRTHYELSYRAAASLLVVIIKILLVNIHHAIISSRRGANLLRQSMTLLRVYSARSAQGVKRSIINWL